MVLILVVVDDGLVLHKSNTARHQVERVLILIVVDDGLVQSNGAEGNLEITKS